MRLLRSVFLASSCMLSSTYAADSAATPDDAESYDRAARSIGKKYEMGFEVETSGIKVNHDDEDAILVILESADKKWQLTTDTRDDRIDSSSWVNLECRTVGGLTQAEISKYISLTQHIIRQIKTLCDQAVDGRLVISKTNYLEKLNVSGEHIHSVFLGLEGKFDQTPDEITFSTKRKVTKEIKSRLKIITSINESLVVYLFTNEDSSNEEKCGLEVELLKDKDSLESIEEIKRKISHELLSRLRTSSEGRIELNQISAIDIFNAIFSEGRYKVALSQELTVTLSNTEGVFASLDCTLRPQLTFSFPIKEISTIFMNVLNQEHASYVAPRICRLEQEKNTIQDKINEINKYLESSKDISAMTTKRKTAEKEKLETDRDALKEFQRLTVDLQSKLFQSNTNVQGLCILILEYIVDLFVLNQALPNVSETGPKAFLKVVSRLPFSEMLKQFSQDEIEDFNGFIARIDSLIKERLIKPYRKDAPGSSYEASVAMKRTMINKEERIKLNDWLQSIPIPVNRCLSSEIPVYRDLLSPPPYTDRKYSMGVVVISPTLQYRALIEARGYGNLLIRSAPQIDCADTPISVDNIVALVNDEARKFFALTEGDQ